MKTTKVCPGCEKEIKWDSGKCECGYDFTLEPCPGCERRIASDAAICPHCQYNLLAPVKPKAPPKPPKVEKPRQEKKREEVSFHVGTGGDLIIIMALGRANNMVIDFKELHFHGELTDESLQEWGLNLRDAWKFLQGGYLSNHAIGHYCMVHSKEKVLQDNWRRIRDLLGGDDAPLFRR